VWFRTAAAGMAIYVALATASCASPDSLSSESLEAAKAIGSEHAVRIVFSFRNPDPAFPSRLIHGSPPSSKEVDRYLGILRAEASRLPPHLLRCGEIRTIALVKNLTVGGRRRFAVPARTERTLVLDVGDSSTSLDYLRWTFHHELFHLLDYSEDELIRHDPEWEGLNPIGFAYGAGGDRVYHDPETAYRCVAPPPGFVTLYATMGAEEDKAETFAAMMTSEEEVEVRLDSDEVIAGKLALLNRRLATLCGAPPTQ
jgi:hypothetical protein